jgi:outer membrane biosynthesis protein TonB
MGFCSHRLLIQALIASVLFHLLLVIRVDYRLPARLGSAPVAVKAVLVSGAPDNATVKPSLMKVVEEDRLSTPASQIIEKTLQHAASAKLPPKQRRLPELSGKRVARVEAKSAPTVSVSVEQTKVEAVSVNDVAEYRVALAVAAKRFKIDPASVKARGKDGIVVMALLGNALSTMPEVQLVQSSGTSELDEYALGMTRKSLSGTVMPDGLRGKSFRIPWVVRFDLNEDQ